MSIDVDALTITLALLGAATFVVAYPVVSDQRRWTREGWHIWSLSLSLLALAGFSLARRWLGEWAGYDLALSLTYAAIAGLLWQRVLLLWLARRDARRERDAHAARRLED